MLGYFWKQTHWDNYRLLMPKPSPLTGRRYRDFRTYEELFNYCKRHGIDATQV